MRRYNCLECGIYNQQTRFCQNCGKDLADLGDEGSSIDRLLGRSPRKSTIDWGIRGRLTGREKELREEEQRRYVEGEKEAIERRREQEVEELKAEIRQLKEKGNLNQYACAFCEGHGYCKDIYGRHRGRRCPACNGTGRRPSIRPCAKCGGTGWYAGAHICSACGGTG